MVRGEVPGIRPARPTRPTAVGAEPGRLAETVRDTACVGERACVDENGPDAGERTAW
ncbi:hypothetical protein GCM10010460_23080 [Microbacterium terrae]|nr:hypothetical protein GCM10017594_10070 [Microbacterium terrae]